MSTDTLTDLLNKVTAIVRCGASSFPELAKETGIPYKQVHALVTMRRNRPDGERSVKLFQWAARKTRQIAMAGRELQNAYKSEYRKACEKFPSTGGARGMTKEALWRFYCTKNPTFAEEIATVTMTAKGLRKLFNQTFDVAHEQGFRNGQSFAALHPKKQKETGLGEILEMVGLGGKRK